MSCWASNTTWLEPKGTKSLKKGAKRARHVALGVRHVVLGLQHDVARAQRHQITQKGSKRARHVALGPRHDALDLQRDVARAPRVRIPQKEGKTSAPRRIGTPPCRVGPPTRRGSSFKGPNPPKKRAKRVRHVALGPRYVALDLQRDAARVSRVQIPPKREQNERATSHWECAMSRWTSNTTWLHPKGAKAAQKGVKKARHVALGPRYVALDLQRDVAPQLQTPSY